MDKDFETEVLTRLARIETKLDDYDNLKSKVEDVRAETLTQKKRIDDIEDKTKWLERTILGTIITGSIGIIFIIIKLGLGIN